MNVPKLRFKEFNDEWKNINLSEISSKITKGTTPKKYDTNGINFIKVENIHNNSITNINSYISKDIHEEDLKRSILQENDVLFSIAGALGRTAIIKNDILPANTNQACAIIRLDNPNSINLNYFINRLNNIDIQNYIFKCQSVGAQPNLSLEQVSNICIAIPSIQEQEKIGAFLSLLDKKIEFQSKKIEALKLYKKGLSNDLIDCINEYNEFTLKDIGTTYSGLSGKAKEDFENGNSKFISFMSVLKDKIEIDKLPTVKIDSNENQNKVQKNDLFFNTSSETKEEVALCSTINEDTDNLYLNSFCFGYRINDLKLVNNEYLNIMLHCTSYRKLISNLGQGFTRVNISKKELMNLIVKVPSIEVQIKIVDIINKVKNIIDLEVIKLSKLQQLKKGLMQQLFI